MIHFVSQRAQQRVKDIEKAIVGERVPLAPLTFAGGDGDTPVEVGVGHRWTGAEASYWIRGEFTVPAAWAGARVGLFLDIAGCEPLLYLDGVPAQALDYNHPDVLLYETAAGGEAHAFAIDAYAPSRGGNFEIKAADLVRLDRAASDLFYDFQLAAQALDVLGETTREYQGLVTGLDAAMNALEYRDGPSGDAFYASLPAARTALRSAFFDAFPADATHEAAVTATGHAHIDVAWLWTLANTRKKVGRTFATALRLMDEFPEYVFTQSQPQLYQYAKEDYPELYERLKTRVAEGRWEPTGGMWVEPDLNVPSGESLIRQALVGNRFFEREFGVRTKVLWLPDCFGFPASLPQIMAGCGLPYFMTTKMAWNQFNTIPADTFAWRGIDGTEVLAHFVSHINNPFTAKEARRVWDEYKQKDVNTELLMTFGHGDGGGGPTRIMLETGRRLESLAGFPRTRFGPAEPFFDRLAAKKETLPRWNGELYLEFHRGTYTSQAAVKKANRKTEILLHNAELFASLAGIELDAAYPVAELARGWEKLLLNQFHDILPGSSITPVYADAARDFAEAERLGKAALDAALDAIAGAVDTRDDAVIVFNPTDTLRPTDVVRVEGVPGDGVEFADENGAPVPSQKLADGAHLVLLPEVGTLGYQTITVGRAAGRPEAGTVSVTARTLENDFVRLTLDDAGEIVSLVHKIADEDDPDVITEREIAAGDGRALNALVLYEDKPMRYDAWDIDIYYRDKAYPVRDVESIAVIETGPVRAGIEIKRRFQKSSLTQRIYLHAHSPRVTFETEVDWQERQMLLKAHFPVAVNAVRATYDIQFGAVERATHQNTSWDWARFEVCAHKWADLSEGDYGVSLLNDCKYGCSVLDDTLSLTLLKGAIGPDPTADLGAHAFTYALLPHTGDWRGETVDDAYALNYPLLARFVPANRRGTLPTSYAFATVDDQGIVLETIKKAEDDDDDDALIIRLYEAFNTRGSATLTLGFEIADAVAVDLVEGNPTPIPHTRNTIPFTFRPFEIKTFRVRPRR